MASWTGGCAMNDSGVRACFKIVGVQERAKIPRPCRPGPLTGRFLKHALRLGGLLASQEAAMQQLRRSGLFVASGSHPAKSPVGAASSTWMPLLRSFGFLPFAIYKDAAPMGLGKARLTLS